MPGNYKVQFVDTLAADYFYGNAADTRAHVPEWYDNTSFAKAKTSPSSPARPSPASPPPSPRSVKAVATPEINGQRLGRQEVLRLTRASGPPRPAPTSRYEWLVGDTVVGDR